MAKGPIVTAGVEALIASVYQQHPKWKAPRVRYEVEEILHKKNPNFPKGWPSLSKVQKILATVRKNMAKPSPEDEPWSLLTLSNPDYDIAAEALPTVFDLWAYALREYKKPLTIREIKWAARLYRIIQNDKEELLILSDQYATSEKAYKALGDKSASIVKEIGFQIDTELYVDTHMPKLTTEELLKVRKAPKILKRKRQNLLQELRSPEILRKLGLENLVPEIKPNQLKQKRGKE